MVENILGLVYPRKEIFVKSAKFLGRGQLKIIDVWCNVRDTNDGSHFVSAKDYLECIKQAAYLFIYRLIKENIVKTKFGEKEFIKGVKDFKFRYQDFRLALNSPAKKGETFSIELRLKKFKEKEKFSLFVFTITKAVISGEVAFIFEK